MVVIDTHLARGASSGGAAFHNQGGPYGRTNGAKRIVCVDVTGLALCVRVVPASTSESSAVELILDDLARTGADERLELVLVDRGTAVSAATRLSAKFNGPGKPVSPNRTHAVMNGPGSRIEGWGAMRAGISSGRQGSPARQVSPGAGALARRRRSTATSRLPSAFTGASQPFQTVWY